MTSIRPRHRTLIADDQLLICNVVREALTQEGHDVEVVRDGAEFTRVYAPERFTLLVLDIMMPHKTGVEIVRELRKRDDTIPIILMSSYMSDEIAQATDGIPNLVLLAKPFGLGDLRTAVERAVGTITC